MALSKKHFERIAQIVAEQKPVMLGLDKETPESLAAKADRRGTLLDVAANLASFFAEENAQFDRARFMKACGF